MCVVLVVFVGGFSGGVTPGPFPNPEAKPVCADGTAPGRVWESRSLPAFLTCVVWCGVMDGWNCVLIVFCIASHHTFLCGHPPFLCCVGVVVKDMVGVTTPTTRGFIGPVGAVANPHTTTLLVKRRGVPSMGSSKANSRAVSPMGKVKSSSSTAGTHGKGASGLYRAS